MPPVLCPTVDESNPATLILNQMLSCDLWVHNCSKKCSHLHIKTKVLLLFKEEIEHKLPDKVRVQRVINYFCPTELEKCRERTGVFSDAAPLSEPCSQPAPQQHLLNTTNVCRYF